MIFITMLICSIMRCVACIQTAAAVDVSVLQVPDGVNIIAIGPAQFGLPAGGGSQQQQQQLVYTGGNCSVTGFDSDGRDQYWTVSTRGR